MSSLLFPSIFLFTPLVPGILCSFIALPPHLSSLSPRLQGDVWSPSAPGPYITLHQSPADPDHEYHGRAMVLAFLSLRVRPVSHHPRRCPVLHWSTLSSSWKIICGPHTHPHPHTHFCQSRLQEKQPKYDFYCMTLTEEATKMKRWECRQEVVLRKTNFDGNVIIGRQVLVTKPPKPLEPLLNNSPKFLHREKNTWFSKKSTKTCTVNTKFYFWKG